MLIPRTLKLTEIVYIVFEESVQLVKGRITAIDFKQRDFYFNGSELNVDVEIEITETLCTPTDFKTGEHIHVKNQEVYQIVPDSRYLGEEVCYECNQEYTNYQFYCPVIDEYLDESDFDANQPKIYKNGYEYVQAQIESGRWILYSDAFDVKTALADAWNEGYAQAREACSMAS